MSRRKRLSGEPGPKPRTVAATATPTASSVMTVSAPLATDLSARSSVISRIRAKKPAAASVTHIGNSGERQIPSSEAGQAQFMRDIPSRSTHSRSTGIRSKQMVLQTRRFERRESSASSGCSSDPLAYGRSCASGGGELAFAGDTLESFGRALDPVLTVVTFGREAGGSLHRCRSRPDARHCSP